MSISTVGQPMLHQVDSLSISPELFEKLYLSPKNQVKGDLRSTFGNPTPLALVGLIVALTPLSIELMGWRGATGLNATTGVNYFFGGILLVLSGVLEFFLGNTFPSVVFLGFGAHFLTFGATFTPFYAAISSYTDPAHPTQTQTPMFESSFGFYVLFMGVLSFIFLICSLRTNVIFVIIFISATLGFCLAAAAFWTAAQGMAISSTLLKGTGGSFFVASMAGWYLLAVIMFTVVDLPGASVFPIGDLSALITGRSAKLSKDV